MATSTENQPLNRKTSVGFESQLQTVRMIVQPFVMIIPVIIVWHFLYTHDLHSSRTADEPIVNAILPGLFAAHVFLAGFLFYRQGDDLRELREAIRNCNEPGNKEKFLKIAEDRIPGPFKYVLFVTANIVQWWTVSLYYEHYITGLAAVVSVGYILSLIWEVIADLDDPLNGVWVVKGAPEAWIQEANIQQRRSDKIFKDIAEWLIKLGKRIVQSQVPRV